MIRRIKAYFYKKQEEYPIQDANNALSLMAKDIYHLKRWTMYIHDKQKHSHHAHRGKIEVNQKEIEKASRLAMQLDSELKGLKKYLSELTGYLSEMHNNHLDIIQRISTLEEGHQRTIEGTTEGHQRTPKGQERTPEEVKIIEKGGLNEGHKELLNLFYQTSEPLDYPTIARILRKREKSIRNMIYELRNRGYSILDRHIGFRKKGFYIGHEEKIRLSGR